MPSVVMPFVSKLVIAAAALSSCVTASAQLTAQEDADRRARNREEAMANWQRSTAAPTSRMNRNTGLSPRATDGDPTTRDARQDARTVESKARQAVKATRSFTHRQAEKVRDFGERQQEKFPDRPNTRTTNKSDRALGK